MKKISLLIAAFSLLFVTQNTQAQTAKGDMRLGAQLGYGTEIESLGIGARFDYAITDQILLAPDLMYFFGKSQDGVDFSWFDINLNGNYVFEMSNPDIIPYVLAGLNIAFFSVDFEGISIFPGGGSSTNIGLNLGGGVDFVVSTFFVFGELRYVLSSSDQLVISGGVKFPLN